MKVIFALALLLSCLAATLMADASADMKKIVLECMNENGVTEQEVADLESGKTKPEDVKNTMKCATQCLLAKTGLMDAAGKLQPDALKSYVPPEQMSKAEQAFGKCNGLKGENPCDTAFQILSCVHDEAKIMGM